MTEGHPPWAELQAPSQWTSVDFISDLHLHAGDPATLAAWQAYVTSTTANAVFMLGDVFEIWVGDDAAHHVPNVTTQTFEAHCGDLLKECSKTRKLFFMAGNRDFLVGPDFLDGCGVTLLQDPTVFVWDAQRFLLTHGDALCLADTDYQAFRQQVRTAQWQQVFLAQPLERRRATARDMRNQSAQRQNSTSGYVDVDQDAVRTWLARTHSGVMIHGHTHRPDRHMLGQGLERWVLSDWDCRAVPPRAEILRLQRQPGDGAQITARRLELDAAGQ